MKHDRYGVRLPDTPDGRSGASLLIERMYTWRGYQGAHELSDDPHRITLTATDKGVVVGTLTIGIDCNSGMMADHMYGDQLDVFRRDRACLCEVTKLAFDHSVQSKHALANLFHLAFIYARDIHGCTDAVIEVNPRHRRFYERMLGFRQLGELKTNERVNAPSYLLHVGLDYVAAQVERLGGTHSRGVAPGERSLYPYFFSPDEERGIAARLLRMEGA